MRHAYHTIDHVSKAEYESLLKNNPDSSNNHNLHFRYNRREGGIEITVKEGHKYKPIPLHGLNEELSDAVHAFKAKLQKRLYTLK